MNRQEIITLAESLGLLYPEPKSSSDYNHPAHMRFISKLEKFAEECYNQGYDIGATEAIERERG
jgi:regulator of RNase E activity RraB